MGHFNDIIEDLWIWITVCFVISIIFASATLLVYAVAPELQNVQGSIIRCCLVAYISWLFCTTLTISLPTIRIRNDSLPWVQFLYIYSGCAAVYFGAAYIMWLNVMSFDIWKKFRTCSSMNISDEDNMTKFDRYKIYAWGGALVTILIFIGGLYHAFDNTGQRRSETTLARVFLMGLPVLGTSICNTCFYISTAFNISKLKKETLNFTNGENKHHKEHKQWFNLYLKLFVIMEGPLLFYIPGLYFWNHTIFKFISVLEGLQGILIFLIFVWKDDVKRSFRKQFVERMLRLGSSLRCDSTLQV